MITYAINTRRPNIFAVYIRVRFAHDTAECDFCGNGKETESERKRCELGDILKQALIVIGAHKYRRRRRQAHATFTSR